MSTDLLANSSDPDFMYELVSNICLYSLICGKSVVVEFFLFIKAKFDFCDCESSNFRRTYEPIENSKRNGFLNILSLVFDEEDGKQSFFNISKY